jgi:hypothetical protein
MKRLNMFQRLTQADQTIILHLCDRLPYKDVAEQLAKPRIDGGLGLATSPTSLCKFYTRHHPEAVSAEALGQFAAAMRVNHQAHGEANFEALLGLVQTRLLEAVRKGQPVAELDKEFRTLERVQKCFLAEHKFRENNPRIDEAYQEHIKKAAIANEVDYVRTDDPEDPGTGGYTADDFEEETQYELDLEAALDLPNQEIRLKSTFYKEAARIVAALSAAERQKNYVAQYKVDALRSAQEKGTITPVQQLDRLLLQQMKDKAAALSNLKPSNSQTASEISPEISPNDTPQPHAISHISPNFLSPNENEPSK